MPLSISRNDFTQPDFTITYTADDGRRLNVGRIFSSITHPVMRDEEAELHVRLDAAKRAAPYVHPKLAAITHTGKDGGPLEIGTVETREVSVRDMAKAFLAALNRPQDDVEAPEVVGP